MYPHGVKIIVLASKLVVNSIFGCPQNDVHEDFSVVLTEESLNVQGWDSMGEKGGGGGVARLLSQIPQSYQCVLICELCGIIIKNRSFLIFFMD